MTVNHPKYISSTQTNGLPDPISVQLFEVIPEPETFSSHTAAEKFLGVGNVVSELLRRKGTKVIKSRKTGKLYLIKKEKNTKL